MLIRDSLSWWVGLVDPHRSGERGWFGLLADEPRGVRGVGGGQDLGAVVSDGGRPAEV
jgi:hypothetical protein